MFNSPTMLIFSAFHDMVVLMSVSAFAFVCDIFRNIGYVAFQNFAELVDCFRADRLVVPQAVYCTAAYVVLLNQRIG